MDKKFFFRGGGLGAVICAIAYSALLYSVKKQPDFNFDQVNVYNMENVKDDLHNYTGKPMVINIWGTWCGPCVKELPYFQEVQQEVGDAVTFVMISDEKAETISRFIDANTYTFNFLRSEKLFKEYGITARPVSYFYNADGQLITKHVGRLKHKKLKQLVELIK